MLYSVQASSSCYRSSSAHVICSRPFVFIAYFIVVALLPFATSLYNPHLVRRQNTPLVMDAEVFEFTSFGREHGHVGECLRIPFLSRVGPSHILIFSHPGLVLFVIVCRWMNFMRASRL
ncbi:hypothetical protein EDB83DRAFT_216181 [Lactarius deliciosus]|nr:hypothetical protein EDB83DRAFT_216181 [Lactarius deliciosus]